MASPDMAAVREAVARTLCDAEGLRWEDQRDPMTSGSGNDDTEHFYHLADALLSPTGPVASLLAERGTAETTCDGGSSSRRQENDTATCGTVADGEVAEVVRALKAALDIGDHEPNTTLVARVLARLDTAYEAEGDALNRAEVAEAERDRLASELDETRRALRTMAGEKLRSDERAVVAESLARQRR